MAQHTSVFRPSPGTGGVGAGDAEAQTAGGAANDPTALLIVVGNESTGGKTDTGKASMMLRFDLDIPESGPAVPHMDVLGRRPIVQSVELVLQVAADPVVDGATGELKLGMMERIFDFWINDLFAFGTTRYPDRDDLPFPTLYDDTIVSGTLRGGVFLTSAFPMTYDETSGDFDLGKTISFYDGVTPSGDNNFEVTDLIEALQAEVNDPAMFPGFSTAFGMLIDAADLPGDTVAEEYISFGSSQVSSPALPPELTIVWDDGEPVIDAGPDDSIEVNAVGTFAGSVTYATPSPTVGGGFSVMFNEGGGSEDLQAAVYSTDVGLADAWTIAAWIKPLPSVDTGGFAVESFFRADSSSSAINEIVIGAPHQVGDSSRSIHVEMTDSSDTKIKDLEWTEVLTNDTWNHVAVTYIESLVGQQVFVFVDSVDLGAPDIATIDITGTMTNSTARKMALAWLGDWQGQTHALGLWSVALSSADIAQLAATSDLNLNMTTNGSYRRGAFLLHWYRPGEDSDDIGKDYATVGVVPTVDLSVELGGLSKANIEVDAPTGQPPTSLWAPFSQPGGSRVSIHDDSDPTSLFGLDTEGAYTMVLVATDFGDSGFDLVDWTATAEDFTPLLVDAGPNSLAEVDVLTNLTGEVTWSRDEFPRGDSLVFGDGDQFFSPGFPSFGDLGISNAWSVLLWFKADELPAGVDQYNAAFKLNSLVGTVGRVEIRINHSVNDETMRDLRIQIVGDGPAFIKDYQWNNVISTEAWHQLVVVWDGNDLLAFIDTVLQGTPDLTIVDGTGVMDDYSRSVVLGWNDFNGLIHQVAIWSYPLSSNEIASIPEACKDLQTNGAGYLSKDDLQHWYQLNKNTGSIGEDTGNASVLVDLTEGVATVDLDVPSCTPLDQATLWTVDSQPGGSVVFLGDDTDLLSSLSFDTEGTYLLRLTATDTGDSAFDTVTYTVEILAYHCPKSGSMILERIDALPLLFRRVEASAALQLAPSAQAEVTPRIQAETEVVPRVSVSSLIC